MTQLLMPWQMLIRLPAVKRRFYSTVSLRGSTTKSFLKRIDLAEQIQTPTDFGAKYLLLSTSTV
jgi:hypothetical protein